jgi:hypothetical protein
MPLDTVPTGERPPSFACRSGVVFALHALEDGWRPAKYLAERAAMNEGRTVPIGGQVNQMMRRGQ